MVPDFMTNIKVNCSDRFLLRENCSEACGGTVAAMQEPLAVLSSVSTEILESVSIEILETFEYRNT